MLGFKGEEAMDPEVKGRLLLSVEGDSNDLVARAEALRQAGKFDDALALIRVEIEENRVDLLVRVEEALIHLERGQVEVAQGILEGALADAGLVELVSDDAAEGFLDEESTTYELEEEPALDDSVPFSSDSPFANPTMANLLDRQGYSEQANALRQEIISKERQVQAGAGAKDSSTSSKSSERKRSVVATLERWLNHLQRGPL